MAEPSEETLPSMTSSLLTVPFLQLQAVVQNSPVQGNLVLRMIMSVISMMTVVTIPTSLVVVRRCYYNITAPLSDA